MNLIEVDHEEYAEFVEGANVLATWNLPNGLTLTVAEYAGSDWFFFFDPASGGALLIDGADQTYGGSTHDHIRHAQHIGTM